MNSYGIIMAGGGGERFWPLSRRETPKQLLNLTGKEIMVNEAIGRLSRVCNSENIYIVTGAQQANRMREATKNRIAPERIFIEPAARNTAACVGYAAMRLLRLHGDGILVITPSDAYIRDEEGFAQTLRTAVRAATEKDCLVTVGIQPAFPATGYGYIRCEKRGEPIRKALRFVEKPELRLAKEYAESGEYVWNSGMFVWKASVILEKYRKFVPEIYEILEKICDAIGTPEENTVLGELYPKIPSVSIDYAIMEKSEDIYVVPGNFGWNDVGSWDMLSALHPQDGNGNVVVSDFLGVDTHNCVLYSKQKLIATVGLENVVIVDTPDALLVCAKDRAQDVKKIVEELRRNGREELL